MSCEEKDTSTPDIEDGQYVQVYYNLHRNCLSVQNRERIVIAYCEVAAIRDAEFWVSETGRQRVLEEKCKNVHAKIRGSWYDGPLEDYEEMGRPVRYNPYLFETFVYADTEEPVHQAGLVVVDDKDMYVL